MMYGRLSSIMISRQAMSHNLHRPKHTCQEFNVVVPTHTCINAYDFSHSQLRACGSEWSPPYNRSLLSCSKPGRRAAACARREAEQAQLPPRVRRPTASLTTAIFYRRCIAVTSGCS